MLTEQQVELTDWARSKKRGTCGVGRDQKGPDVNTLCPRQSLEIAPRNMRHPREFKAGGSLMFEKNSYSFNEEGGLVRAKAEARRMWP